LLRLVLCGSALSVMSGLLSGQRALRGRVSSTLRIDPFDFREAASYWDVAGNWPAALRRPSYRVAEPIVRFHHVITRPDIARFEERRAAEAWADAQQRFATHILGPHFEDLARTWTMRYASERTVGGRLARVGATQLADPAGRSQLEIDVVGVRAGEHAPVSVLGEAKSGSEPVGVEILDQGKSIL
jgi:hypothetical protein